MLDTRARKYFDKGFNRIAGQLLKCKLRPNHVTALALVVGLGSAAVLYVEQPLIAVGMLWLSGLLDAVDGSMARQSGKAGSGGAMFDIVADRIVELSLVWALALRHPGSLYALLGLVTAILLSMTVFLTTGMLAEKTGEKSFYYQAGLMERSEGFIAFTAMILLQSWLTPITWVYAGLIGVTIVQRLWEAQRLLKKDEENNRG